MPSSPLESARVPALPTFHHRHTRGFRQRLCLEAWFFVLPHASLSLCPLLAVSVERPVWTHFHGHSLSHKGRDSGYSCLLPSICFFGSGPRGTATLWRVPKVLTLKLIYVSSARRFIMIRRRLHNGLACPPGSMLGTFFFLYCHCSFIF